MEFYTFYILSVNFSWDFYTNIIHSVGQLSQISKMPDVRQPKFAEQWSKIAVTTFG